MITVKPVAFNIWEWNEEKKETEKHPQGYYPFYFLNGRMRNSAIQGYNTTPLFATPEEAMSKYEDEGSRVAPDWYTKVEMEAWHPEDALDKL